MLKNQKGITLVALVVTIVILIILATVAISFAFGNNGLGTETTDEYMANSDYRTGTFMNESTVLLQQIQENIAIQQNQIDAVLNPQTETQTETEAEAGTTNQVEETPATNTVEGIE